MTAGLQLRVFPERLLNTTLTNLQEGRVGAPFSIHCPAKKCLMVGFGEAMPAAKKAGDRVSS